MQRVQAPVGLNQGLNQWLPDIKLIFAASLISTHAWFGIRIICPSGATCLPADCIFSEATLKNLTKPDGLDFIKSL